MPNYEYECTGCKRRVEEQRPIAHRDWPRVCAVCFEDFWRVPAAPGMAFKGKGWTPTFHPHQKGKR